MGGRPPEDPKGGRIKCHMCAALIRDGGIKCNKCNVCLHERCFESVLTVVQAEKATWCCKNCVSGEINDLGDISSGGGSTEAIKCQNLHLKNENSLLKKLINELENVNKLQSDRIQDLEAAKNVITLSEANNSTSLPSYSGVLKNPVNKPKSAVLIIKSDDNSLSNNEVLKDITKKVNPAKINACINSTRKIRDGIAVYCEDQESLHKLKNCFGEELNSKYSIKEAKKFNPRIIIKNVKLNDDLNTEEEIIDNIVSLNDLGEFDATNINVIIKLKHYTNFNIVIEVPPLLRKLLLSRGYVFIGWKKCQISDHLRTVRCYKCCSFGHVEKDCKSKLICPICSGEHTLKNCQSEIKKCINCVNYNIRFKRTHDVNHSAKDSCCPVYQNYVSNLKLNINYE